MIKEVHYTLVAIFFVEHLTSYKIIKFYSKTHIHAYAHDGADQ